MSKKEPIIIEGQKIGRLKASWLLFKESGRYLKADSEMILLPFITGLINLFVFGVLVTVFLLIIMGGNITLSEEGGPSSPVELLFIFACYVVGAFTLALSQAGISHTVYTRAHGGDATLGDSLKAAFSKAVPLFIWSLITSTVGIILRMIAERSKLLGKIVVMVVGVAWSVLTYFVVPAIMIDKLSATDSIKKSGQVFKATWGETIVSNFSLGLTFFVIHLVSIFAMIGLSVVALSQTPVVFYVLVGVYLLWVLFLGLVQSAMEGVLKTLLYIYSSEGTVPPNFSQELLQKMMSRKNSVSPPAVEQSVESSVI